MVDFYVAGSSFGAGGFGAAAGSFSVEVVSDFLAAAEIDGFWMGVRRFRRWMIWR